MGAAAGCATWGEDLVQGRGTKANRRKGMDLLKGACTAGEAWACGRLKEYGEAP